MLVCPQAAKATPILPLGNIFTTTCNGVCPELTTSQGQAQFTLVADSILRSIMLAFFEVPNAYRGGTVTWSISPVIGNGIAPPLASGTVKMTQWDMGPVNINGIPLEEYYENFNVGSGDSGIALSAGTYNLTVSDRSSPPDQFGLFWATNSQGLAFAVEGQQLVAPEPAAWMLTVIGVIALLFCARRLRSAA